MDAFEGTFIGWPLPLIMGHELVGRVEEIGEKAPSEYRVKIGDRVVVEPYIPCGRCRYCLRGYYQLCENRRAYGAISCKEPPYLWGAYGEYMYVAPGSRVRKISEDVPLEAAVMANVIGNGVRWVCEKGKVGIGDTVIILGPGAQGLASTIVAKYRGAGIIILAGLARDKRRLELGREFGADHVINVEEEDPIDRVREITNCRMADVVIACVGSPSAIKLGLDLLRPLGTYVIIGNTGGKEVPFITDKIVWKELTIVGGLGQALNVEAAIKLIETRKYPIEKMITHKFSLREIDKALKVAGFHIMGELPIKVMVKP